MADTCRKIYVTAIVVLQWISLSISIMAPEYLYSVVPVSQSESLTNKFCHKFILLVVRASFDQVWVFEIAGVKLLFNILIESPIFFRCHLMLPGLLIVSMDVVMMLKPYPRL